ncbi:hypothetical protein LJC15_05875, partial [Desulfovibrio sp. OttesenSCG-928-G11]|nr:hypothetical protein [Desulfovibrio sp. OttesenSCG-928-G11]
WPIPRKFIRPFSKKARRLHAPRLNRGQHFARARSLFATVIVGHSLDCRLKYLTLFQFYNDPALLTLPLTGRHTGSL